MTKNMDNARPSISRRSLVVGAGLLTSLGLFGCSSKPKSTIPEVMSKDEEWQSAYDEAIECWETLQSDMTDASDYLTQLQGQRVKNSDSVTALQEAIDSASTLEDEASDLSAPKDAKKLAKSTKKLKELAQSYEDASSNIADARAAIEVIQLGQGAFDYVDGDGYSYHIEYDVNPDITIDSSEGKPGFVGLNIDFSDSSVTVTNTTSGKKAPGIYFYLIPLYAANDFGVEEGNSGPLNSPSQFSSNVPSGTDTSIEPIYQNPFKYGISQVSSNDAQWGTQFSGNFEAGVLAHSYGQNQISDGGEFEPGESRNLTCSICSNTHSINEDNHVADIREAFVEAFKKPITWCVWPNTDYRGIEGTAIFKTEYARTHWMTYNPVE